MEIKTATASSGVTHRVRTRPADDSAASEPDRFTPSPPDPGLMKRPASLRTPRPNPNDSEATSGAPVLGRAEPAPSLVAGDLRSPKFLGTEAEYFKAAHGVLQNAQKGDIVGIQMYEFQNAKTNADPGAVNAPGYADQQALLPGIADAANRGVKVHMVLDASKDEKTGKLNNQPILDWLKENDKSGNVTVDLYPPNVVNIDHAKEIFHLTPSGNGKDYKVQEVVAGGSNWGNHTPANDDGGGAFFGRDAVGAVKTFYRDQAFCRGDVTSAPGDPTQDPKAAVQWRTTAPTAEGGGSHEIKDAKLELMGQAKGAYVNEFCLNDPEILAAGEKMGKDFHARVDPSESHVNRPGLEAVRQAGGQALWANTVMDPTHMPGQKNHEKLDVYTDGTGQAFAATLGSANDTNQGLEGTHKVVEPTGQAKTDKPNHEIDAVVRRVTTNETTADGTRYSTAQFLDDALRKTQNDLAHNSSDNVPSGVFGGGGTAPTF